MALRESLLNRGIRSEPLTVSHAFHSRLLDPMLEELREAAADVASSRNLTGQVSKSDRCGAEDATSAAASRNSSSIGSSSRE